MISKSDLKNHASPTSCWVKISDKVYDLTSFLDHHPGGVDPILSVSGSDATDAFFMYHPDHVHKRMKSYEVGTFLDVDCLSSPQNKRHHPKTNDTYKQTTHIDDFRMLHAYFQRQGIYKANMIFYMKQAIWMMFLFSFSLYLSLTHHPILGGGVMGLFWQQIAGIGHDLGHSSVFYNSMKYNHLVGSLLTSVMGLSLGWWRKDHNTHHVVCNSIDFDPNIQHMPLFAISDKILFGFFDQYHKKEVRASTLSKQLIRHQHLYAYPLLIFVARWNLYVEGIAYLLKQISEPNGRSYFLILEGIGVLVFILWVSFILAAQTNPFHSLLWLSTSHAVAGILHVQIVLSHWTMQSYFGKKKNEEIVDSIGIQGNDWYMTQLETTMNIQTNPLFDWVHLGLQFQIEHHMFPKLPRHNLRLARKYVKQICAKHNLPYVELGFFEANLKLWSTLKEISSRVKRVEM